MSMAAMSPSQEALFKLFEKTPRFIAGRKVHEAVDPAIRRDMENSVLAQVGTGNESELMHCLGAVCRELRCKHAREAITTVLVKANTE